MTYRIIRMYYNKGDLIPLLTPGMRVPEDRTIRRNLTLEEAQAHCNDPETSSRTCKLPENVARTEQFGPWFDGYDDDR